MSAAGAHVDVLASEPSEEMLAVAADPPQGAIVLHRRPWEPEDLAGSAIAVGAFEDDHEARRFAEAARAAGVPVNLVDKPAFCDFSFGSIVNRSPLVVGISTDGAAPVFAQAIRARIEALIPRGFGSWAAAARRWRDAVKSSGLSFAGRRRCWQLFTAHAVAHPESATVAVVKRAQCGVVVAPGQPDVLADTLRSMVRDARRDEALRVMGDRGRAYVEAHYERGAILRKWDGLLATLTA